MKWAWAILAILFFLLMTGLGLTMLPVSIQRYLLTGAVFAGFCAGSWIVAKLLPGSLIGFLTPCLGYLAVHVFSKLNPALARSLPADYVVYVVGITVGTACLFSFLRGSLQKETRVKIKKEDKDDLPVARRVLFDSTPVGASGITPTEQATT